jgi:hypothetical protein
MARLGRKPPTENHQSYPGACRHTDRFPIFGPELVAPPRRGDYEQDCGGPGRKIAAIDRARQKALDAFFLQGQAVFDLSKPLEDGYTNASTLTQLGVELGFLCADVFKDGKPSLHAVLIDVAKKAIENYLFNSTLGSGKFSDWKSVGWTTYKPRVTTEFEYVDLDTAVKVLKKGSERATTRPKAS